MIFIAVITISEIVVEQAEPLSEPFTSLRVGTRPPASRTGWKR